MGSELQKGDIFQAIADPTRREVIRLLSVKTNLLPNSLLILK